MHTYRISDAGNTWEVGFVTNAKFDWIGRRFGSEAEAAAFVCFLNGGRYCPDEIAHIFGLPPDAEDAEIAHAFDEVDNEPEDHTTPPSKSRFTDYPQEGTQAHKRARG